MSIPLEYIRQGRQVGQPAPSEPAFAAQAASSAPQPAELPINTSALLAEIEHFIRRFLWLQDEGLFFVIALWLLMTHSRDAFARYAYLAVLSPERECAKTLVLELLEALAARPWKIDGPPTEAVMFRKLDADRPTLMLDEIDQLFRLGDQRMAGIVAILNAGYKDGATVPRCTGEGADLTTRDFKIAGPKAFAGIATASLPDTLRSRAIPVGLHRLPYGEHVERWRSDREEATADALRAKCEKWAAQNINELRAYRAREVSALSPRSEEIWEPLFAIAALAGRDEEAITIAIRLAAKSSPAVSQGSALLAKLRELIGDESAITTTSALRGINADDGLSFGGWNGGEGMSARDLARILARYDVRPTSVRAKGVSVTAKGYRRSDLEPVWSVYATQRPEQGTDATHENARVYGDVPDVPDVPLVTDGVPPERPNPFVALANERTT